MDPSLRNWGWCLGYYDKKTKIITMEKVGLIQPVLPVKKSVRNNSLDLESAYQLTKQAYSVMQQAQATFVEVPSGSQNARAMAGYGICVGVLGALRTASLPFFELTEMECKMATTGLRNAKKGETIAWATLKHPELAWPTYKRSGTISVSESQAEHMADAVAAVYAGVSCNSFQQMLPLLATTP